MHALVLLTHVSSTTPWRAASMPCAPTRDPYRRGHDSVKQSPPCSRSWIAPAQLVATRLYGSGLRIMEAVRLRVKDRSSQMKPLTVRWVRRPGRVPPVPATLTPCSSITSWGQDAASAGCGSGDGEVYLPLHGLGSRRLAPRPGTGRSLPRLEAAVDRRAGSTRRHQVRACPPQGHPGRSSVPSIERHQRPYLAPFVRATHLLQRGTDIRTIQQLLGHNDVATTMVYTHIFSRVARAFRIP